MEKIDNFRQHTYVVMPAYNEGKYLDSVMNKLSKITRNIVLVDDNSQDETYSIAQRYTPHVLHHKLNLGKGAALKTGCEYAFRHLGAKAVIFMDSDDQHDSNELQLFFAELARGSRLVFGARKFSHKMPLLRIIGNRFASVVVLLLFGSYIPDIPSGFKAMTKKTYHDVCWDASDYGVEIEIAARSAKMKVPFTVVNITTIYHDMDRGMTMIDVLRTIFQMIVLRLYL